MSEYTDRISSGQVEKSAETLPTITPAAQPAVPRYRRQPDATYHKTAKTDSGIAEIVEAEYGHILAITPEGQKDPVSIFDHATWTWEHQKSGELRNKVTTSAGRVSASADTYNPIYTGSDPEGREEHQKKAEAHRKSLRQIGITYQNSSGRNAASAIVRDSPRMIKGLSEWENKPWEVAFRPRRPGEPAKKINLRTGKKSTVMPEDLLVRSLGIPMPLDLKKDVSNSLAIKVIHEIFEGSEDLIDYYGESIFGTLVGEVDKVLNWVSGPTGTGKTVLSIQQHAMMGSYWDLGDFSILEQRVLDDHRFTMGRFEYTRALHFDETGVERCLDARKAKTLTSGNEIEFERKGIERNTYQPKFTPWVFSNYDPKLYHDDGAVMGRLRIFKLKKVFETPNENYKNLDFWLPYAEDLFIWAWGFRERYLAHRLRDIPLSMRQDVDNNQYDNDWLGQALGEICAPAEDSEVELSELFGHIRDWRLNNGHGKLARATLRSLLRDKGYKIPRGNPEMVKGLSFNPIYDGTPSIAQTERYIH